MLAALSPAQQQRPGASGGALGQNAALRYWTAFSQLPKMDDAASAGSDAEAAKLAEAGANALLYLRRGAAIGPCDWGLYPEDGPYLLLPHLSKGRDLARLGALKIRADLSAGRQAEAVDTAGDALVMGRHLSSGLTAIVSYLVQIAVERIEIEALAPHLAGLDAPALERLDKRLAALPPGGSLEACLRVERESFLDWAVTHLRQMNDNDPWKEKVLGPFSANEGQAEKDKLDKVVAACGGTRQGVLNKFEELRPFYEELGRIIRLPREQFAAKFAELEARAKANPLAVEVLPSMVRVYDKDAAARTRLTMLRAAVAVARGGADKAKGFKDAAGQPLEYQATADGFELRSNVVDNDKAVTLKVGGKK